MLCCQLKQPVNHTKREASIPTPNKAITGSKRYILEFNVLNLLRKHTQLNTRESDPYHGL